MVCVNQHGHPPGHPDPTDSYESYEWYEYAFPSVFTAYKFVPPPVRIWRLRGGRYESERTSWSGTNKTDITRDTPIQQIGTSRTNGTNLRFRLRLQFKNSYRRRYEFGDGVVGGTNLSKTSGLWQPTRTSPGTPRSNRFARVVRMVRICVSFGFYSL